MQNVHEIIYNPANGAVGAQVTFAASTSMLTYTPSRPVRIIRWGVIVTTAPVDTGSANLQFSGDVWPTANVNTSKVTGSTATVQTANGYNSSNALPFYVDTAGGTLTVPNAQIKSPATVPIGTVIWHNVNPQAAQTGGYYPAPETALISPGGVSTQLLIYPGQTFAINCVSVGTTAGVGKFFLEVEEQAFVSDFNNNALVISGYPNTNGTTPTPSWPFSVGSLNYQN